MRPLLLSPGILLLLGTAFIATKPSRAEGLLERPLPKLVDCPTAGGPATGWYDFELRAFPEGGLLVGFQVGLLPRFALGVSYGGTKVISAARPSWNPQPGVLAAFRLINEGLVFPALAVGFNSQGYGRWNDSLSRYQFKAKGLYGVFGKNFALGSLGEFSLHAGANRNPVEEPRKTDLFGALDYRPAPSFAVIVEYSAALDDRSHPRAIGLERGYLNTAVRWNIGRRLALDLILRDILVNQKHSIRGGADAGREIRVTYIEELFPQ